MSEFGRNVIQTGIWARGVLKFIDCVKLKGIRGKVEPSKQLLAEDVYLKSCLWVAYEKLFTFSKFFFSV